MTGVWLAIGVAVFLVAAIALPRFILQRSQDRLARQRMEGPERDTWKLLTRADLVVGKYRRLPGLLGLNAGGLVFQSLFGDSTSMPNGRIVKITTGHRLASGRTLVNREVLRVARWQDTEIEFILTRSAASAWRSHLGLWAMAQRQADADRVSPGPA